MSAPAALAIAKIIHPELQKSKYAGGTVIHMSCLWLKDSHFFIEKILKLKLKGSHH